MVYFMGEKNPYLLSCGVQIIGDTRKNPLREMRFLDPEPIRPVRPSLFLPNVQAMGNGYPVVPEDAPKRLYWNGAPRKLPDVLMYGSVMIVCEALRDLIEQFDPGRHQLIPVEVTRKRKGPMEATYYWFNICTLIDSVDRARTKWEWAVKPNDEMKVGLWKWESGETHCNLVFNRRQIGDHHIWMDCYLAQTYWCSQAFGDAAKTIGFAGLNLNPFNEVD